MSQTKSELPIDKIAEAMRGLPAELADGDGEVLIQGRVRFWRNPLNGELTKAIQSVDVEVVYPRPMMVPRERKPYRMPPEFEMLSVRTKNVLRNGGIESLEQLRQYTVKEMLKFRQCGTKTIEELSALLDLHQLQFNP